eukprot:2477190-Rhodomonas_salina.1
MAVSDRRKEASTSEQEKHWRVDSFVIAQFGTKGEGGGWFARVRRAAISSSEMFSSSLTVSDTCRILRPACIRRVNATLSPTPKQSASGLRSTGSNLLGMSLFHGKNHCVPCPLCFQFAAMVSFLQSSVRPRASLSARF